MIPFLTSDLPAGRVFGLDSQTLIQIGIQLFNVLLLAFFLTRLLYKPVGKFLAARKERIEGDLASAEKNRDEAAMLKGKYEHVMENVDQERQELLDAARKKATERGDQVLFEAKREAESHTNRALANLEMETKNAEFEMRKQVVELSTMLAERFVQVSIDAKTQDKLIDEAFAGWEKR